MISLKNITSFSEFKKMNEAVEAGTEFSNTTGFRESLLGRATFGLFRMVKNGINAVRLEYFKRKLENEYFAGLLRYCKKNNIDLKNPQKPKDESTAISVSDENEMEELANDILTVKFNVTNYENILNHTKTEIQTNITAVSGQTLDENGEKLLNDFGSIIKLIESVININKNFVLLSSGGTTLDTYIDVIINEIKEIKSITLTSTTTPITLDYIFSDEENKVIENLKTSNPLLVPKLDALLAENLKFNDYFVINEKVDNSSGTGIDFILGDEISTDGVGKFLKDQNVNSVEDINFKQLASIFDDKMKENATKHVNKNGVIRIAVGVSKIIYHVTKTPDNVGINPGKGGGIDKENPTSLMKPWQSKVQKVQGEFNQFLIVKEVDPFTLDPKSYNSSEDPGGKKMNDMAEKSKEIDRIAKIIELGDANGIKEKLRNFGVIRLYKGFKGPGKFTGPVFQVEDGTSKIYKYVGSLSFDAIVKDFNDLKKLEDTNTGKYETIFLKNATGTKNGDEPGFLPIKNVEKYPTGSNMDLVGIYLSFSNSISPTSNGEYKSNEVRIFYVYFPDGKGHTFTTIPTGFEIYALNSNGDNLIKITDKSKLESAPTFDVGVGETFEISDPLKKDFTDIKIKIGKKLLEFPGVDIK